MTQSNPKQHMNQALNVGVSHSRSLSQPAFFANYCLPPLSPFPPSESSSIVSSNSNPKDVSMEDIDVSSRGSSMPPPLPFRPSENRPPRKGHRRANSDVPFGFPAMVQSSPPVPVSGSMGNTIEVSRNDKPAELKMREMDKVNYVKSEGEVVDDLVNSLMNLDHLDALNSDVAEDKDHTISGGENETMKLERAPSLGEGFKRSASGDIAPPPRHHRSLSMDSAMGKFCLGNESPNFQINYVREKSSKLNLEFGHGEFSDVELKKIMADERLAEIAVSDPKRAKRVLANRQSAARSKERKLRYISELEHKVQTLQTEATNLSAQVTILQKEYSELTSRNSELKFRVQALEQQAHIRDALHEALSAEVHHLKLRGGRRASDHMQRMSVSTSTTSNTSSA